MREETIASIRTKFRAVRHALNERARRLWAGAEAEALGRGGVAWVSMATGMAISTVRKGRDELRAGVELVSRQRRPGGGRPRLEKKNPDLLVALERLVHPTTRGDPESPLRWTCKSVRVLARELTAANHRVGPSKVGELLNSAGYSLQANAKTREGRSHPDRDAQFAHINAQAEAYLSRGVPVISVDAKKKEAVAEHANPGREWQPRGAPVEVATHDFFEATDATKAIPYGIYDVGKNVGFVNVGMDHNTPTFAVRSIEKWWERIGSRSYPDAKEVFITADAGGSNGIKSHVWKAELQKLADRTALTIHVSHFPPGTSKWNKIEHRLFSFITLNWRGRPLATYETIISLISATTTSKGLRVQAVLDSEKYPLGRTVRKSERRLLKLEAALFHGEWNYALRPRSQEQLDLAATLPSEPEPVSHADRKAKWIKLIQEQKASGLSNRRFCRERGINLNTFNTARRRLVGQIRARRPAGN